MYEQQPSSNFMDGERHNPDISVHGNPKHCSRNEPILMMLNAYIQKWELLSDSLSVVNWMLASMSLSVQETPVTV